MKLTRNYYNYSNSKNIGRDRNPDLNEEIEYFLQEKEYDISKTKVYKGYTRKSRGNEYKHHKIT